MVLQVSEFLLLNGNGGITNIADGHYTITKHGHFGFGNGLFDGAGSKLRSLITFIRKSTMPVPSGMAPFIWLSSR